MNRAVLFAALAALSACYQYRVVGPVDEVAPAAGTRVAARLTERGAADLAPQLGSQVTLVEGEVLAADANELRLAVSGVEDNRSVTTEWKGEPVTLPRSYIASLQVRRFSAGATGLFGGLVAGSLAAAYALFGGGGEVVGAPPGGGPGPGQQ